MSIDIGHFLAGVILSGKRMPDNTIESFVGGEKTYIDDWPELLTVAGNKYTLETVVFGDEGYESAEYV